MSVSVKEALELTLENAKPLTSEDIGPWSAAGRVLSLDLTSAIDQPPFPRSPLDGYAVRAEDTAGATAENPVALKVTSKYFAGENADRPVLPGEASRIMTGSMLPSGADCVIRQEDTDEGEDTVLIYKEHKKHDNYVFAGEDFKAGQVLLPAGTYMDAAAMAVAAAAGCTHMWVRRRPRVSVISTGDELTQIGVQLSPGKIYDSCSYYLKSRVAQLGGDISFCCLAGDDETDICSAIDQAAGVSDLILTTGGVSVGQKDLVPAALERMGARFIFRGVKMKPGMPTTLAVIDGIPVLALSGNPFAAAVAFELFGKAAIYAMGENPAAKPARQKCVLENGFEKSSPGLRYIRGICREGRVTLPQGHSNGQMRSMVGCNCLVEVMPGTGELRSGDEVEVLLL